jgi:hypothetical protein
MTLEEKRAKHRENMRRFIARRPDYYKTEFHRKRLAEAQRKYRAKYPEKTEAADLAYKRSEHGKRVASIAAKKWYAKNAEKKRAYSREWGRKNRARIRESECIRINSDANFKLRKRLADRVGQTIKRAGGSKSANTVELLGCSIEFARGYLEARFKDGMTWRNHGSIWHIDHRIPCAEFDLTDPAQQRQCFHYSNLQPLFVFDNLSKNSKRPASHQAELI